MHQSHLAIANLCRCAHEFDFVLYRSMAEYLLLMLSLNVGLVSHTAACGTEVSRNESRPLPSKNTTCSRHEFCSIWHYCHEEECKLGELPPYHILRDDGRHTSVLDNMCVTYNTDKNVVEVGCCIYNFIHGQRSREVYCQLPTNISELNEYMCGGHFNRTGTLCGKCADGTYPLVYSYEMTCVPCPNGKSNWWKFVLAAFLPLTVFYIIVLFLKINITSSPLFGFVYAVQTFSHPELIRVCLTALQSTPSFLLGVKILATSCGIWNLDFFRGTYEICLGTNTLQTMALELAIGIYPLLLMVLSYLLIILYDQNTRLFMLILKPLRCVVNCIRTNWDIRTSTIDVFATFFLLSNVKFLSISYDLLTPVKVYQLNSTGSLTHSWRLYYDASLTYFGEEHLPYAILAIASFLFFVLFPLLLLVLYPFRWFQKLLNLFPFRWYILHTFVDSFQGCYKDGTTEMTRDCRWFASLFFLLRLFLFILSAFISTLVFFAISALAVVLLLILLVSFQPFKENVRHYFVINAGFLLLVAIGMADILALHMSATQGLKLMPVLLLPLVVVTAIALLYAPAIIVYYIGMRRCWMYLLMPFRRLQAWRQGYNML